MSHLFNQPTSDDETVTRFPIFGVLKTMQTAQFFAKEKKL